MTAQNPNFSHPGFLDIDTGQEANPKAFDPIVDRVHELLEGLEGSTLDTFIPGSQEKILLRSATFLMDDTRSTNIVETLASDATTVDIRFAESVFRSPEFMVLKTEAVNLERTALGGRGDFVKQKALRRFNQDSGQYEGLSTDEIAMLRTRTERDHNQDAAEALDRYDAVNTMPYAEPVTETRIDATLFDLLPLKIEQRKVLPGEEPGQGKF